MKATTKLLQVKLESSLHAALVKASAINGRTMKEYLSRVLKSYPQVNCHLGPMTEEERVNDEVVVAPSTVITPVVVTPPIATTPTVWKDATVITSEVPALPAVVASGVPVEKEETWSEQQARFAVERAGKPTVRPDGQPYEFGYPQTLRSVTYHSQKEWNDSEAYKATLKKT